MAEENTSVLRVQWHPWPEPLDPVAVAIPSHQLALLERKLSRLTIDECRELRRVDVPPATLVIGPERLLPWLEEATYLGHCESARNLLLPTYEGPDISPVLFEAAIRRKVGLPVGLLAVLPRMQLVIDASSTVPMLSEVDRA